MIKKLASLLKKGDTVTLTVALEGDGQVRLNVYPKLFTLDGEKGSDRKALNQPLTMTGTPEEFDSPEFFAELEKYTGTIAGLRTNLDEVEAAATAAKESAAKKTAPAKPAVKKPAAVKPAPKPAVKVPARPAPKGVTVKPVAPAAVAPAPEAAAPEAEAEVTPEAEPAPAPEPPKPVAPPTALGKTASLI